MNDWHKKIEAAKQDAKGWIERAEKVVDRYKDKRGLNEQGQRKFNILWSNTETLKAALFARYGKPDIRRRFGIQDLVGSEAARILERTLEYLNDIYDPTDSIKRAVEDMLLTGRGVVRQNYKPVMTTVVDFEQTMTEDGMIQFVPVEREVVADQKLTTDYVFWKDFLHSPARGWMDVEWVAFKHCLSDADLRDMFGEAAEGNKSTEAEVYGSEGQTKNADLYPRTTVWEVWDKATRKRIWVSEGKEDPLREEDDPYGLEGFFPCTEPLFGPVTTNDTLIPEPEFCVYQDQADELDRMTMRIAKLMDGLRRRGVYDATYKNELSKLAEGGDNFFVAIDNFAEFRQAGGLPGVFSTEEIVSTSQIIAVLYNQRQSLIQQVYEITGISDILRGSSDPRETATAQKIKGKFGSLRLQDRQASILTYLRDNMRLQAEIVAEHFEPDVLAHAAATDPMKVQMVTGLLRDEKLRGFTINVESESTAFEDAQAEKQSRMEFIAQITAAFEKWIPAMQAIPALAPLAVELIGYGVRAFKSGSQLEETITRTLQQVSAMGMQPGLTPTAPGASAGGQPGMQSPSAALPVAPMGIPDVLV